MKIAKWNADTQQPYDIRYAHTLKAGNGVPLRDWSSRHQRGYYEYVPIELAEGEGLDNEGWQLIDNVITQTGTVLDAETVAQIEQEEAHQHLLKDVETHGLSVIALGAVLDVFGLSFPVEASEVDKDIKRKLVTGQLTPEQVPFVSVLSIAYSDLRSVGDDRIVQIAGYLQDNPQVAQGLMEGESDG